MKLLADILIYCAGILWSVECVPQIAKLVKTKNTTGISLLFFSICLLAYTLFLIGNLLLGQWSVIIANLLPFIMISIIVYLVIKYRKEKIENY